MMKMGMAERTLMVSIFGNALMRDYSVIYDSGAAMRKIRRVFSYR